jgi:hypothetical protein
MNIIELLSKNENISKYVKEYELRPGTTFHINSARPFDASGRSLKRDILDDATMDARAESFRQLIFAGKKLFKENTGGFGAAALEFHSARRYAKPGYFNNTANLAISNLEKQLQDLEKLEGYRYRLDRRHSDGQIFTLDITNNYISSIIRKFTPFRAAISKGNKELLARYDISTNSSYDIFNKDIEEGIALSIEDMTFIFGETYKYLVGKLESVEVESTDDNIANLFALSYQRPLRVIKESLDAMPYFKVHKDVDKNLAIAVGEGLDYEKLLLLNVVEYYPADTEELNDLLKVPSEWITRLIGL